MRNREICITECDYEKLNDLVAFAENGESRDFEYAAKLKREIENAKIVHPQHIGGEVVTMNSKVVIEYLETHEIFNCQIVYPSDADIEQGKISVLAPIGTALLGYKVGDTIRWQIPSGVRKIKIKEIVYQPESAGDWHV